MNGRSVALTGMIPSNRVKTRIKLLALTKRFHDDLLHIDSKFWASYRTAATLPILSNKAELDSISRVNGEKMLRIYETSFADVGYHDSTGTTDNFQRTKQ